MLRRKFYVEFEVVTHEGNMNGWNSRNSCCYTAQNRLSSL